MNQGSRNRRAVFHRRWGMPAVPARAEVMPELLPLFEQWLEGFGVLVVEAPEGFGKSTQVAAFLSRLGPDETVIWLGAGAMLGSWPEAQQALLAAVEDLGLIGSIPPDRAPLPSDAFIALQRLTSRLVLVYDDVDLITPVLSIDRFERDASRFPLLRTVVISSTPLPDDHAKADRGRITIGREKLAWSPRQAQDVLGATSHSRPRGSIGLDQIVAITDGRASAILNYVRLADSGDQPVDPREYRRRWISERAAYRDPSGRALEFLQTLSLFVHAPLGILSEVGFEDVPEMLPGLRAEGLVVVAGANPAFPLDMSLHPEDREALAEPSGSTLSARAREVHSAAAAYFIRVDRPAHAMYHFAALGHFAEALEQLKKPFSDSPSSLSVIRDALVLIPIDVLFTDVEAMALMVISAAMPPVVTARSVADAAGALLRIPHAELDALPLRTRVLGTTAMMIALLHRGRSRELIGRASTLADELETVPWDDLRALGRTPGLFWTVLAETYLLEGSCRSALRAAKLAVELNREIGHPFAIFRAKLAHAAALAMEGDIEAASRQLEIAREIHAAAGWPSQPVYSGAIAELYVSTGRLDPHGSATAAIQFRQLASGVTEWSAAAESAEAVTFLQRGDLKAAFGLSHSALHHVRTAPSSPLVRHLAISTHADILTAIGRPGAALSLLSSIEDTEDHTFCYGSRRAAAYLSLGEARKAIVATDNCVDVGVPHALRGLTSALFLRAEALESLGLERAADTTFSDAISLLREEPRESSFFHLTPSVLAVLWRRLAMQNPALVAEMMPLAERWVELSDLLPKSGVSDALSERESEVLSGLIDGSSYREIGESLFLSANTVKSHVSRIYRKLGVQSRREAIDVAQSLGLSAARTQEDAR